MNAGIKAEVNVSPTSSTIMAKRAAVSGVPNRAEKERGHPADGGSAADVIAQMEQFSHVPADAAAHLQSGTLAAGRTAEQVGEHRAQKDSGHQQQADRLAALHGAQNVVGAHASHFVTL